MATGDTFEGQRITGLSDPYYWAPGAYGRFVNGTAGEMWAGKTPNGHIAILGRHDVTEHDDGTITVSPSILVQTSRDRGVTMIELWHGFLERGVWRSC